MNYRNIIYILFPIFFSCTEESKKINYSNYIKNKDVVIITNKTVADLYLSKVKGSLKRFTVDSYIIPDGERFKNVETLNKIHNFLIK